MIHDPDFDNNLLSLLRVFDSRESAKPEDRVYVPGCLLGLQTGPNKFLPVHFSGIARLRRIENYHTELHKALRPCMFKVLFTILSIVSSLALPLGLIRCLCRIPLFCAISRSARYRTGIPQLQALFRTMVFDVASPERQLDLQDDHRGFFGLFTAFLDEIEIAQVTTGSGRYVEKLLQWMGECRNGRGDVEIMQCFIGKGDSSGHDYASFYLEWLQELSADDISELCVKYRLLVTALHFGSAGYDVFLSKQGLIGKTQTGVQEGDKICVLLGGRAPFILREVGHGTGYVLVAPCFVLGLMDGEVIQEIDEGKVHLEEISIV